MYTMYKHTDTLECYLNNISTSVAIKGPLQGLTKHPYAIKLYSGLADFKPNSLCAQCNFLIVFPCKKIDYT